MHDDWCMIPMTLFSVYNLKFDAKATFEKWLASKIKFIQLSLSLFFPPLAHSLVIFYRPFFL